MADFAKPLFERRRQPRELYNDDFVEKENPAHPRSKRLSLRLISATKRFEIVKLAFSKKHTYQEIADRFRIKVTVVNQLATNLKRKGPSSITKKREKELKKLR